MPNSKKPLRSSLCSSRSRIDRQATVNGLAGSEFAFQRTPVTLSTFGLAWPVLSEILLAIVGREKAKEIGSATLLTWCNGEARALVLLSDSFNVNFHGLRYPGGRVAFPARSLTNRLFGFVNPVLSRQTSTRVNLRNRDTDRHITEEPSVPHIPPCSAPTANSGRRLLRMRGGASVASVL